MTLSSYLTNLIIPYNLCVTLVVIGLVLGLFRLRKTGGAIIAAGLLWALAWSLPATSPRWIAVVPRRSPGSIPKVPRPRPSDAIAASSRTCSATSARSARAAWAARPLPPARDPTAADSAADHLQSGCA